MSIVRSRFDFEDNFVQIPNAWLRDARLSRRARGLMAEMASHRVGWRISLESLVKSGPEGRDAIRTALHELEEFGYLKIVTRNDPETGRLDGKNYELMDPFTVPLETRTTVEPVLLENRTTENPSYGKSTPKNTIPKEDQSLENEIPTTLSSAVAPDAVFDEAWDRWPKKQGRKLAGQKWKIAVKRFPGSEAELAARAREFADAYKVHGYPVDLVPGLSVWLNQDRWNDPLPAPRYSPRGERPNKDQQAFDVVQMGRAMDARRQEQQAIEQWTLLEIEER